METYAFKLNIRENGILLLTGGGATYPHFAQSIHIVLVVIQKCLYGYY